MSKFSVYLLTPDIGVIIWQPSIYTILLFIYYFSLFMSFYWHQYRSPDSVGICVHLRMHMAVGVRVHCKACDVNSPYPFFYISLSSSFHFSFLLCQSFPPSLSLPTSSLTSLPLHPSGLVPAIH